jgi:cytochrome oxidase Cu insertion factor (SCO1/SenC/PrrC family)
MAAVVLTGNPRRARLETREFSALSALAFLLAATAAWWALALWPAPGDPPEWLSRARWVCFNVGDSGLPSAAGWLLLIGEPLGLGVALVVAFKTSLFSGLRALRASEGGQFLIAAVAALLMFGATHAAARIARLTAAAAPASFESTAPVLDTYPRLDRPAPALGLVDQHGARIDLDQLRGRPALVTFAFAHCETVCPALVSQALAAQRDAASEHRPRIVIVTLDPWRDTPSRLPALAESWRLGDDALVLSGAPDEVNATLDRWNIPRARNELTGQVDHPALVYLLGVDGRIAFAANGDARTLGALLARL